MAIEHQKRPGDKAPPAPRTDTPAQKAGERDARAQEALQSGAELDAETARAAAGQMGNAAMAAALAGHASQAAGAIAGGGALEEEEEQAEEESGVEEEAVAKASEGGLPSFSGGGNGGGAAGGGGPAQAPWESGLAFGGDDDDGGDEALPWAGTTWRPAWLPEDPDDDASAFDTVADDDDDGAAAEDPRLRPALRAAESALGSLPWSAGILGRAMRNASRLVAPTLEPESLADLGTAEHALPRLRRMIVFAARHLPHAGTRELAGRVIASGHLLFPRARGRAGATARLAACAEAVLDTLPAGWGAILDIAADGRARPWAEQAASALAREGDLAADHLFTKAWGPVSEEGADRGGVLSATPPPGEAHLAVIVRALEDAAEVVPYPEVDSFLPAGLRAGSGSDAAMDAVDALLAALTGAPEPDEEAHAALWDTLRRVMAALGRTQVELAAGGLAAAAHLAPTTVRGILREADLALRRAARALADAGGELRAGDPDDAFLPLLTASTLREAADTGRAARAAGFRALADALAATLGIQESRAGGAGTGSPIARWTSLELAALRDGAAASGGERRVARVLLGAVRIAHETPPDPDLAWAEAGDDLAHAIDAEAPFLAVDAVGRLVHGRLADDGEEAFVAVGGWLAATERPAALQLLKAVWVEEALRGAGP